MKKIGIIGGMGSQATVDLFQKIINLTPAHNDQEHIPLLIDNNTEIPDRMSYILDQKCADPTPFLIESAQNLQKIGAEAIIMPCNTAHFFMSKIIEHIDIPFLNIADCTVDVIEKSVSKDSLVAILSTQGTRLAKIYDNPLEVSQYAIEKFTDTQQQLLHDIIYKGVKGGNMEKYIDIFNTFIAQIQAEVIILACTELPVYKPYLNTQKMLIDPTNILAQAAVNFSLGK